MRFLQCARVSNGSNLPLTRIVLHCTVSPCVRGGAWSVARYFASPTARGSAHEVTDPGETVLTATPGQVTWHAPPNPRSYGVEMTDPIGPGGPATELPASRWFDRDHTDMLTRVAARVRVLAREHNIPLRWLTVAQVRAGERGLCIHDDVSRAFGQSDHWDVGRGFPKDYFLRLVQGGAVPPPEPERRVRGVLFIGQKERGLWFVGPKGPAWVGPETWGQAHEYLVKTGLVPVVEVPDHPAGPAVFDLLVNMFSGGQSRAPYGAPPGEDPGFYPESDIREYGISVEQYTAQYTAHLTALREVTVPGHDTLGSGSLAGPEVAPDGGGLGEEVGVTVQRFEDDQE